MKAAQETPRKRGRPDRTTQALERAGYRCEMRWPFEGTLGDPDTGALQQCGERRGLRVIRQGDERMVVCASCAHQLRDLDG